MIAQLVRRMYNGLAQDQWSVSIYDGEIELVNIPCFDKKGADKILYEFEVNAQEMHVVIFEEQRQG